MTMSHLVQKHGSDAEKSHTGKEILSILQIVSVERGSLKERTDGSNQKWSACAIGVCAQEKLRTIP